MPSASRSPKPLFHLGSARHGEGHHSPSSLLNPEAHQYPQIPPCGLVGTTHELIGMTHKTVRNWSYRHTPNLDTAVLSVFSYILQTLYSPMYKPLKGSYMPPKYHVEKGPMHHLNPKPENHSPQNSKSLLN